MSRASRYAVVAVGVLAIAGVAAAVGRGGGDGGGRPELSAPAAPMEVLSRTEELVDRTRPTAAVGDQPGRPERSLPTVTYYPAGDGPFPLIVFAHGNTVPHPDVYAVLLRSWAAAGYVVAAPIFPLSSTRLPGAGGDLLNQPADVSFVISEMLRLSAGPSAYTGMIDPDRIAAAGHSLGAMTTLGAGYHSCCRDARIRAGIVLAGAERPFPNGEFFPAVVRAPILVVHGDADPLLPMAGARRIFDHAAPPKFLLTVLGGDHDVPYVGSNGQARPETRVVTTATRDFLDRYLKGEGDLDRMNRNLAGDPLARLEIEDE